MYKKSLLCWWFFIFGITAYSQSFPYEHFTTADGLPSNTVYSVYKDHAGFLWFGTDKGIARYNGLRFEQFTTADGLPDNEVFSFKEDAYGRLWLATYNGRLCYYKNGAFHSAANTPFLKLPLNTYLISNIQIEKDSSVTLSFAGGSYIFVNIKNEKTKAYLYKYPDKNAKRLTQEKLNENLYKIIFSDHKEYVDSSLFVNKIVNNAPDRHYLSRIAGVPGYLIDSKSIYTLDEVPCFNYLPRLPSWADSAKFYLWIYPDSNACFICTRDGLFNDKGLHILNGKIITSIEKDIDGNYWVTCYKDGVYKLSNPINRASVYRKIYSGKILHAQAVNGKLYYYTSSSNKVFLFEKGKDSRYQNSIVHSYSGAPSGKRINFYVDNKGKYICYYTNINNYYSRTNNNITIIENDRRIVLPLRYSFLNLLVNSKYLFIGNSEYLISLEKDLKHKKGTYLYSSPNYYNKILSEAFDADQNLWFSTNTATYKTVDNSPVIQHAFRNIIFRKFKFIGSYLLGYDDKNVLYASTGARKTFLLDTIKTSEKYIFDNIYPLDNEHAILTSTQHYLLVTLYPSEKHIKYKVVPIQNPFLPLDAEYIYADSSNCYFLKDGNVTRVKLELLFAKPQPPKALFTKFHLQDREFPIRSSITIPQKEAKNIAIDFTAISFSSPDVTYQYSVTNDTSITDWHDISSGAISFPELNFGTYFIKIRAKCPASDYSDIGSLKLTVLKPFYFSWWFLTCSLLFFIGLLIIAVRFAVKRVLRKRKKEYDNNMRYYGAEYKALNALMNPHFIFNSLNNIQGLINRDEKKAANNFIKNFSTLVRQNMHNVSKGTISLEDELNLIRNYLFLEKMRFDDLINYEFEIDPNVETELIFIPPLLIQPLVENAIKHGLLPKHTKEGLVTIRVYPEYNDICIDIVDNGAGYNAHKSQNDKHHESFGLANLDKRTAYAKMLHKQNIVFTIGAVHDNDGNVAGTIARLRIVAENLKH